MNKRIESYEGLRFFMVMLIVISHQSFLGEISPFNSFFPKYYGFAVLGVDYFFLLSGFGMMLSSIKRVKADELTFSTMKSNVLFGINHVKKLYPLYIITIAIGLIYDAILRFMDGVTLSTILLYDSIKLVFVVPLLQSATGTMTFGHAFNGVGWFLSTLFCIYLLSPWLIYWLRKYFKSIYSIVFFLIVDLFFIVILAYVFGKIEVYSHRIGMAVPIDQLVYISPYRRVFYVMIGMGLGMLYYHYKDQIKGLLSPHGKIFAKSQTSWEVTSLLLAVFYFIFRGCLLEPLGAFVWGTDVLVCIFIMAVFALNWGGFSYLLSRKPTQKLGQLSMYIFLVHYPIKTIGSGIYEHILGDWTITSAIIFIAIEFALTYFISDWLLKYNLRRK